MKSSGETSKYYQSIFSFYTIWTVDFVKCERSTLLATVKTNKQTTITKRSMSGTSLACHYPGLLTQIIK